MGSPETGWKGYELRLSAVVHLLRRAIFTPKEFRSLIVVDILFTAIAHQKLDRHLR
jgi:hypothetical protein